MGTGKSQVLPYCDPGQKPKRIGKPVPVDHLIPFGVFLPATEIFQICPGGTQRGLILGTACEAGELIRPTLRVGIF